MRNSFIIDQNGQTNYIPIDDKDLKPVIEICKKKNIRVTGKLKYKGAAENYKQWWKIVVEKNGTDISVDFNYLSEFFFFVRTFIE